MQAKPTHRSFLALDLAVHAIEILRPVVEAVHRRDRDLSDQLRRALTSVALNLAEGNRSPGGHRLARFSTAAGSNAEARAALRVAVAWGYVTRRRSSRARASSIESRGCSTRLAPGADARVEPISTCGAASRTFLSIAQLRLPDASRNVPKVRHVRAPQPIHFPEEAEVRKGTTHLTPADVLVRRLGLLRQ
jgi:four helix bundle protein